MRNLRRRLAEAGARGGRKSRRKLDPETAREMVRIRERRRAHTRLSARLASALSAAEPSLLASLAERYVWWMAPPDAARHARRVVAQVMNLGIMDDVALLRLAVPDALLRDVLRTVIPGEFSGGSWTLWHLWLGLAGPDSVPPLPVRRPT